MCRSRLIASSIALLAASLATPAHAGLVLEVSNPTIRFDQGETTALVNVLASDSVSDPDQGFKLSDFDATLTISTQTEPDFQLEFSGSDPGASTFAQAAYVFYGNSFQQQNPPPISPPSLGSSTTDANGYATTYLGSDIFQSPDPNSTQDHITLGSTPLLLLQLLVSFNAPSNAMFGASSYDYQITLDPSSTFSGSTLDELANSGDFDPIGSKLKRAVHVDVPSGINPVPEPATIALAASALVSLSAWRLFRACRRRSA